MNPLQKNKIDEPIMNPLQKNKIDISTLSPDEQKLFRLYGKLPNKTDLLQNRLKERKYFDSGDYALSKAGKASDAGVTSIGLEHPSPDSIPHSSSSLGHAHNGSISGGMNLPPPGVSVGGVNGSPVKEGSYLQRETSLDDGAEGEADKGDVSQRTELAQATVSVGGASVNPVKEGSHLQQEISVDDDAEGELGQKSLDTNQETEHSQAKPVVIQK